MAFSHSRTSAQEPTPRFPPPEYRTDSKNRWQPDVLHQVPSKLKDSMKIHLDDRDIEFERKLHHASYLFIYDAVAELKGQENDTELWAWHHKTFYHWMKSVVERGKDGSLAPGSEKWSEASTDMKKKLLLDLTAGNAAGVLSCRIGQKLASIIRGEIAPLELMMEGNLLHDYYQDHPRMKMRAYKHLRQVAELYAVKNPGANVLEIGAGTGGATAIVLEAFRVRGEGGSSGSLLGHYAFTDISLGFFRTARQKFATWSRLMAYKRLDIRSDPVGQSFLAGSYDLIVASAVLHATPNLNKTLTHVRKLLAPGGKLLMVEFTKDSLDTQLIFGTLPGWWLGEEPYRKTSPNVKIETWDEVLRATGFTGVDFEIRDCEQSEFQSLSIILTTAADLQPSYPSSISIVNSSIAPPPPWLNELQRAVQAGMGTCPITTETLDQLQMKDNTIVVFPPETGTTFVDETDKANLEKLRRTFLHSEGILWLTCNTKVDMNRPYDGARGLLRSLQKENLDKRYIELELESGPDGIWSQNQISHIVRVLQQSFNKNTRPTDIERQYAIKHSILHVPRSNSTPESLSSLLEAASLT